MKYMRVQAEPTADNPDAPPILIDVVLVPFAEKGSQSVDGAIICQRFFAVATAAGIKPDHASAVWHDAMHGDPLARELIEEMCDIEIVSFLE